MEINYEDIKKHINSFSDKDFIIERYDLYLKQHTKLTRNEKERLDVFSNSNRVFNWIYSGNEKRCDEYRFSVSEFLDELKLVFPKSGVVKEGNHYSINADEVLGKTLSIRDIPKLQEDYNINGFVDNYYTTDKNDKKYSFIRVDKNTRLTIKINSETLEIKFYIKSKNNSTLEVRIHGKAIGN